MTPFPFCLALALAACLLFPLHAWGTEDEQVPTPPVAPVADDASEAAEAGGASVSPDQAAAKALIDDGQFEQALVLLLPLLDEEVVHANDLFLFGLAAVGAAQRSERTDEERAVLLREAVAAFHSMLVDRPNLVRVRLELARAFFLMGEDDLARRHFEYVLAGDLPAPVAANVQSFLNQIRARERWRFNLGFALAPDSNIGGTSDERIIYIFDLPFRRNAEELTTSGIGFSVWGGAEYQVPVDDGLRLRAGAETARREYEGSEFDQLFLGTHAGPRWLLDRNTELSLLASARRRWLGTAPDSRDLGIRLQGGHRVSPQVTVSAQASWHGRRYRTQERSFLDGPVWDASLRGTWVVTPTVRAELSGGYARERPRSNRQVNRSRWLGTGVSVILPLGFTVGLGGEYRWTNYEWGWFPFVPDNGARKDSTRSLRASIHNRAFTVLGFSPQLVLVHEERKTNAQLHGYERTRGELRFVRQF